METNLPTPTTARVYVNLPEGTIYVLDLFDIFGSAWDIGPGDLTYLCSREKGLRFLNVTSKIIQLMMLPDTKSYCNYIDHTTSIAFSHMGSYDIILRNLQ